MLIDYIMKRKKSKKKQQTSYVQWLTYIIIAIIILGSIFIGAYFFKNHNNSQVCINDKCFNVEVADSPEERAQGLMDRKSLGKNNGMLFIFPKEDQYGFWMKNTKIPLDIIWINEDMEIVFIYRMMEPCIQGQECKAFEPYQKARYVLEINGDTVPEYDIKIYDKVEFKNID